MYTHILLTAALLAALAHPEPTPSAAAPTIAAPSTASTPDSPAARTPSGGRSGADQPSPAEHLVSLRAAPSFTVTASTSANLGTTSIGGNLTASLGTVSVRAAQAPTWTATVSATVLTTTGGTIPNGNISYWSGPTTGTVGAGTCTPGQPTAAQAVPLNTARTAFTRTGGANDHTCSWNPTVIVTVPTTAVAGTYTGTITHSAA